MWNWKTERLIRNWIHQISERDLASRKRGGALIPFEARPAHLIWRCLTDTAGLPGKTQHREPVDLPGKAQHLPPPVARPVSADPGWPRPGASRLLSCYCV